ncbi:PREDICTED: DNA repair endonuclease UVH1-like isoform X1 [Camelina sativa]|uniref:DNA repair endonuclease UVH1-like isoform X1 n=1 Tax=Camelina sativa TaxID=90675 RepID=A0ABM0U5D0_CAMSA|nr:PREDICTED: DNA repair endonuclease UVH1-like isoform X1 [Camelina sativa]
MALKFHQQIISDLLEDSNGGLVIISSGLSLAKLIASLLILHSPSQGTLLLLLSPAAQSLKSRIIHCISSLQSPTPADITADLPANQRYSLYSSGSPFFITPRILIVDLLTQRIPVSSLAGIFILNAHSLSETSTEAFIVRIVKSLNSSAYVRAFSDRPQAMVSGFAKTERTMRALFLRRLHLWPRFQLDVSQELEREPPEVVDIRVSMSSYMVGIQKAIIEVMDACLKEMKKTNKVDVDDLTVESGLFKSFDEIVRRQLDPIWHTLGKRTKQLVSDLKTLRKLLDYLVRYDAVSFLKFLDTLRVSESYRSVWLFAESSYKIFDFAKKRVYRLLKASDVKSKEHVTNKSGKKRKSKGENDSVTVGGETTTNVTTGVVIEEVLEEAPKWKVLREILEETQEERQKQAYCEEDNSDNNGIVLVACKDERSCMQLEDCVTNNPQKVMREEWEMYLLSKIELRSMQTPQKKKQKTPKGFGILDGVVPVTTIQNSEGSSVGRQEHEALMAAASSIRKLGKTTDMASGNNNPEPHVDKASCTKGKAKKDSTSLRRSIRRCNKKTTNSKSEILKDPEDEEKATEASTSGPQEANVVQPSSAKKIPPVHFYALESDQPILDILKPSVIIVYHPDMAFVRELEVYKAENPQRKLKVYFIFYDESTEVQKFEASIRRENGAFESLIRQKSSMMIPVDQDGLCMGSNSSTEFPASSTQNSLTRKAGGRKEVEKETQVIVDMREFMSSLPNVLHQKGMKIIPVTLEVGDYILSPSICVERKSIQDLFQSFTSGRLFHQVEMMSRYYRIPVLLIEFSQDKSFSFQSASDISDDVAPYNIISKLSLLVLHFPRLRILWSRSLHATADIFTTLKSNQDEPDETRAIRVGVPSEEGIIENDIRADNYNTSAVEFLRRLPGVTDANYRSIMEKCKSLAELASLPVETLAELMGGHKVAKSLREFFDAKYPTLL